MMPTRINKYRQFTEVSYSGRNLLKKHKLSDVGMWRIQGEDSNCDMSGPHHQPDLGFFNGDLDSCIKYAITKDGFWTWGGGGSISLASVINKDALKVAKFVTSGVREKALAKLTEEEKQALGLEYD